MITTHLHFSALKECIAVDSTLSSSSVPSTIAFSRDLENFCLEKELFQDFSRDIVVAHWSGERREVRVAYCKAVTSLSIFVQMPLGPTPLLSSLLTKLFNFSWLVTTDHLAVEGSAWAGNFDMSCAIWRASCGDLNPPSKLVKLVMKSSINGSVSTLKRGYWCVVPFFAWTLGHISVCQFGNMISESRVI